ncbi:unnamed protein product [Brassicogethes aeneus]|uniref:Large ribosomal subunit protein bL35m n=1 Tax=Brassicogethes aeneus TaxID=1431903 RepID=A0A9P0FH70_BRAAE|nr:unnamed protein product [Brassicogethes aeneus]
MFRVLLGTATKFGFSAVIPKPTLILQNVAKVGHLKPQNTRNFSSLLLSTTPKPSLLCDPAVSSIANNIISRNVTKFSLRKGKRKSVKVVLRKFYRLDWGGWIRTKCGRNKKLWKKTSARKRRLRQHVFCNATQSKLLDKMVGPYWRKPKYYVEDPYNPYHNREEFLYTAKKPRPFFPPEA